MAAFGLLGWMAPSFVGLRAPAGAVSWPAPRPIAVWAEMLRDLLVSNAGLHEAIGKSARVAPAAIRDEVRALYVRAQRGDLSSALARFADDMDDAIADTVVTALQIADQRAVSDLGAMLAAVATSTRETVAMQLRINAARARTYRTAQLIAGIVAFFVGLLVRHQPRLHGAVRHVRRAARADRGGRPRRRVDLGDGRALAPGPGAARLLRVAGRRRRRRSGDDLGRPARRRARRRAVAHRPRPRPAGPAAARRSPTSSSSRASSTAPRAGRGAGVRRRWHGLAARLAGTPSERLARRPRRARPHAGAPRARQARLRRAVLRASRSCRRSLFPLLDVGVPVLTTVVGALLFAAAGWCYPDVEVRSRAVAARRAWSQALTVYVDIVGISLAGGAGVEDALMVAARAGTGPQFAELDATLRAAQTRRRKLWHALDELGARADILPAARAGVGRRPRRRVRLADPRDAAGQGQRDARSASSPRPRPTPRRRPRRWASPRR